MDEKRVGQNNSVRGSRYFSSSTSDSLESSSASFDGHGAKSVEGQARVDASREESNSIDQRRNRSVVETPNFTSDALKSIDHTQEITTVDNCKRQINKKQSYELTTSAEYAMRQFVNAFSEVEGDWSKVGDFTAFSVSISVVYKGTVYDLIPPGELTKGSDPKECFKMYNKTLDLISEFQNNTFDVKSYNQAQQVKKIDRFITTYEGKKGAADGLSAYNEVDVSLTIKGDFLTCNINSNAPQRLAPSLNSDEEDVDRVSLLGDEVIVNIAQNNHNSQIAEKQRSRQLANLKEKLKRSANNKLRFTEDFLASYDPKQIADIINFKLRGKQQEIKIAKNIEILNEDIAKLGSEVKDRPKNAPIMGVIANPAHPDLQRGDGACEAIWKAATGDEGSPKHIKLKTQCDKSLEEKESTLLTAGEAVITDGFNLCEMIVHNIGNCLSSGYDFNSIKKLGNKKGKDELLAAQVKAYDTTLHIANAYNVASTIMGAGYFKVDAYDSLSAAVTAMERKDHIRKDHQVKLYIVYKEQHKLGAPFTDIEIAIAKKYIEYNKKL